MTGGGEGERADEDAMGAALATSSPSMSSSSSPAGSQLRRERGAAVRSPRTPRVPKPSRDRGGTLHRLSPRLGRLRAQNAKRRVKLGSHRVRKTEFSNPSLWRSWWRSIYVGRIAGEASATTEPRARKRLCSGQGPDDGVGSASPVAGYPHPQRGVRIGRRVGLDTASNPLTTDETLAQPSLSRGRHDDRIERGPLLAGRGLPRRGACGSARAKA